MDILMNHFEEKQSFSKHFFKINLNEEFSKTNQGVFIGEENDRLHTSNELLAIYGDQ